MYVQMLMGSKGNKVKLAQGGYLGKLAFYID